MLKNKIYLKLKILFSLLLIASFLITLNSCGIYKKTDAKQFPPNPDERVKKNMDEGRSDSLVVKIFKKNCSINNSCKVLEIKNNLNTEIKIAILKRASFYKSQKKGNIEPYGGKIGDIPAGATNN